MLYTIVISAYECHGKGAEFLRENLTSIFDQSYRPIQCIVSDHSRNDDISNMVKTLNPNGVDFIYVKYSDHYGNPCHNWNNGLKYATGDYIHYLAMDDKLENNDSVKNVVEFMKNTNAKWIACSHKINPTNEVFIPKWNDYIIQTNTISGPSAIVIDKTLKHITFDPQFILYLDLDLYYRLYKEAGEPLIYNNVAWVNRIHSLQLSHTVCDYNLTLLETERLVKKYGNPLPRS